MVLFRTFACVALLLAVPLFAQERRAHVGVATGPVRQGSPVTTEAGAAVLVAVAFTMAPSLSFVSEVELSRTHVEANVSVCYFVDVARNCFHRANRESTLALGGSLNWHPLRRTLLRPHLAAGVARLWSGSGPNAGESSSFFAPQAAAGLAVGSRPALTLDLRLRRLDRWGRLAASGQGALLVGLSF